MSGRQATGSTAFNALFRREIVRFLRQPARAIASVGTAVMLWAFLASGLSGSIGRATAGLEFGVAVVPGMAALAIVFSSIFGAISLIEDRQSGFLQGALVSPAPRWSIALSKVGAAAALSLAQGFLVMLPLPFASESVDFGRVAASLAPLACMSLGIGGISLAMAWKVDSVSGFHGVMNLMLMPMWLLSGGVFPLDSAAAWLRWVAWINPLTWPIRLTHALLAGAAPGGEPMWGLWAATIGFACVGLAAAWLTMGRRSARA